MKNLDENFILQPMNLLFSESLLSGYNGAELSLDFEVIKDLEFSLEISKSQNLPDGYVIWQDAIDNSVSDFRLDKKFSDAENFISTKDDEFSSYQSKLSIAYRKSKLKKSNTAYDDFYFNVLGEVYYQLKMVTLQRYVRGNVENSFLEKLFHLYREGLYPCGMKNKGTIVAYNPIDIVN